MLINFMINVLQNFYITGNILDIIIVNYQKGFFMTILGYDIRIYFLYMLWQAG